MVTTVWLITFFVEKSAGNTNAFDKLRQENPNKQDKDLVLIIFAHTIGNRKRYR
jgi:hypothetical protein